MGLFPLKVLIKKHVSTKTNAAYSVFSHRTLEHRAPHCPADELDISQSLLKALESESDSPPWPSLHVNMDKVRPTPGMLLSNSAHHETFSRVTLPPASLTGRGEAAV